MTGFDSKRQASLDTFDHLPYQGRESRPDELAQENPWRDAIDSGLVCAHIGTVESFPTAQAALAALINWHVQVAIDPEVSSDAQALIDRGAAQRKPLTHEQRLDLLTAFEKHKKDWNAGSVLIDMIEAAHNIKEQP